MLDGRENLSYFDLFRKRLCRGDDKVHTDQKIMQEYHQGKVGISVVKSVVMENNNIPDEIANEISNREFEEWVKGLGY